MTEIALNKDVPVQITPSKTVVVIQNTMKTADDPLFISEGNDLTKKWIEIAPGDSVKFSEPMYVMQRSWPQWTFPVIEHG